MSYMRHSSACLSAHTHGCRGPRRPFRSLEITCTDHIITSLRYSSPLPLRHRYQCWPRPLLKRPAFRSGSTTKTTRIITIGTTTKIALGAHTSPRTTEVLTNTPERTRKSNRSTGTGATLIPMIETTTGTSAHSAGAASFLSSDDPGFCLQTQAAQTERPAPPFS
jgi:hypothetical protein